MTIINKANQRRQFGHGNFQVELTFPGININPSNDPGLLNLGRFDHALLKPGAFIAMHRHQDDEILSLLKSGTMLHKDSNGHVIAITRNHLMMMNSGSGFYHEESIPLGDYEDNVNMLQIFIRPSVAKEPPKVQFADIEDGEIGKWRLVAGPSHTNPALIIRSEIAVYDIDLDDSFLELPPAIFSKTTFLLYVFKGELKLHNGNILSLGDSIILCNEPDLVFMSMGKSIVVAFAMNTEATYTRDGMFSGMK